MRDETGAKPAGLSPGHRAYTVGLLLAITFVSFLDRQVLTILIEPIKADLNLSDTQMGALTGLFFSLFYAIAGLPLARMADIYNKRKFMALCVTGWSLASALTGVAQNFVQLAIARTLVGVGEAGCSPAITSIIADLFPPERRAKIFSAVAAASAVGIGFSVFLGGLLVEHVSWRSVMIMLALPGVATAMLVLGTMPVPPQPAEKEVYPPLLGAVASLWRIPTYRAIALVIFTAAASGFAVMTWIAVLLIRTHDLAPAQAGLTVGSCMAFGFLTGNILCGTLADRLGARDPRWLMRMLGVSCLLNVPLGLICFMATDLSVAIAALAILLVSGGFWAPLAYTVAIGLVGPGIRAVTASTMGIILSVGGALGPLAVGALSDLLSAGQGTDAIRYAMAIVLVGYLTAGITALLAMGRFSIDYASSRGRAAPQQDLAGARA